MFKYSLKNVLKNTLPFCSNGSPNPFASFHVFISGWSILTFSSWWTSMRQEKNITSSWNCKSCMENSVLTQHISFISVLLRSTLASTCTCKNVRFQSDGVFLLSLDPVQMVYAFNGICGTVAHLKKKIYSVVGTAPTNWQGPLTGTWINLKGFWLLPGTLQANLDQKESRGQRACLEVSSCVWQILLT